MTVASTLAAPHPRSRPSVSLPGTGWNVRRRSAAVLGIVLVGLLVAGTLVVIASFAGVFGTYVTVRAILPAGANAPQLDSPVEYLDVTVGQVAGNGTPVGNGQVSIVLHLQPSKLSAIPASVHATSGPLSIFGTQYVDLVAQNGTGGPSLAAGQVIPAIPVGPNASLQTTVGDLYDVLKEIQPVQLNQALTGLADALHGQGTALGQALHGGSQYLSTMIPLLPVLERDLQELTPVANDLTAATPNLLGLLANLAVTGRTIVSDGTALHQLLHTGSADADLANKLFSTMSTPLEHLLIDSGPLLADVSQNNNEIADILTGLNQWAKEWTAAESHGPYLEVSSTVPVGNPADVVLAGLGAPNAAALFAGGLGAAKVNPSTYTAADCPTYGTEPGTDCGGSPATTTSASQATGATVLGGAAELGAVSSIVTGLDGGVAPSAPGVATLLLGPVLQGMTG